MLYLGEGSCQYRRRLQEVAMSDVAVNLLWLRPGKVGGSEDYAIELLRAISESPQSPSIEVVASIATMAAHPFLADSFKIEYQNSRFGRAGRIRLENSFFAQSKKYQLVHHLGGTHPQSKGCRSLVSIYDLQYLQYPEYFSLVKRRYLESAIPRTLATADAICVMSEFVANAIEQHFGYPRTRCYVIPPAIKATHPRSAYQPREKEFILYPAVTWPHKSHQFLFELIEQVDDLDLILTGARGPAHNEVLKAADDSPASNRIFHLGRVSSDQLDSLYRQALCTVFPSQYEGFGLPVLEAMSRDCPVIAGNGGALTETVGSGGRTLPLNLDVWVRALEDMREPENRRTWVELGHERASQFSPNRAAKAQITAYSDLLERR